MKPFIPGTILQTAKDLRSSSLTCEALTQSCLQRIAAVHPGQHLFITLLAETAMAQARARDAELRAGDDRGVLHGIPLVIKDNIDLAGIPTTVGSALFRDRVPTVDAEIVQRLQAVGAVILGKTNLSEFAADVSGWNAVYGAVANPHNPQRAAGGSSSGTAAAVQMGLCSGGIGTDTGGSIRIPAAWCGLVGLRPTQGKVALEGVFPRAGSFDTVGPMTRRVEDAIALFAAIADTPLPSRSTSLAGLRVGVVDGLTFRGVDADVAAAVHGTIARLKQWKAEIVAVNSSYLTTGFDEGIYATIALYEFYQALHPAVDDLTPCSQRVQQDFEKGRQISQTAYEGALEQRSRQIAEFKQVFDAADVLITPTTPTVAPLLTADPRLFRLSRRFVLPFSFVGAPAISVPCGFNGEGLPIGVQLVGKPFDEATLFSVAAAIERGSPNPF